MGPTSLQNLSLSFCSLVNEGQDFNKMLTDSRLPLAS